jgi:hypothetical protein
MIKVVAERGEEPLSSTSPGLLVSPAASTPRTPRCDGQGGAGAGAGGHGNVSTLRKTLDKRRQLVMELFREQGLYPTSETLFFHIA